MACCWRPGRVQAVHCPPAEGQPAGPLVGWRLAWDLAGDGGFTRCGRLPGSGGLTGGGRLPSGRRLARSGGLPGSRWLSGCGGLPGNVRLYGRGRLSARGRLPRRGGLPGCLRARSRRDGRCGGRCDGRRGGRAGRGGLSDTLAGGLTAGLASGLGDVLGGRLGSRLPGGLGRHGCRRVGGRRALLGRNRQRQGAQGGHQGQRREGAAGGTGRGVHRGPPHALWDGAGVSAALGAGAPALGLLRVLYQCSR